MIQHKETLHSKENPQVTIQVGFKPSQNAYKIHELKPFSLPESPTEEYFQSINQDDLFINLQFDQRFILVDQIKNDPALLAEWNANKNTFALLAQNGRVAKDFSAALCKQMSDSFVPFANSNFCSKHWWGVTVGMKYTDYKFLYGLNFQGLIGQLVRMLPPPIGQVATVVAAVIQIIMEILNYLNERDKRGVWIKLFWNGIPWKWGSQ